MYATRLRVGATMRQSPTYLEPVGDEKGSADIICFPEPPAPECRALIVYPFGILRQILADVADAHALTPEDITGIGRSRRVTKARQHFYWAVRQLKRVDGSHRFSLPAIGAFFQGKGGRPKPIDHCTVWIGVRRHEERRRGDLIKIIRQDNEASARIHGAA